MSEELPPVRCDDRSTWRHRGQKIDLPRLLQLIEQNQGPWGLDLHGCDMSGIDARPETLRPYAESYAQKHGADAHPPWLGMGRWHGIDLGGTHLEDSHLSGARLENSNLLSTHLSNAFLQGAHLQNANLSFASLQDASLIDAHLEDAALLETHLENATLLHAHLEDAIAFQAHLEGAVLLSAHLENANLMLAHLQNADMGRARLKGAEWYGAYLDRTRLSRDSLGPAIGDELVARRPGTSLATFQRAKEAYLALKTNFDSIGRYEDSSWAYVKEQQMEKAMYFPTTAGHRWIRRNVRQGHRRWLKRKPRRLARFVRASILGRLQWAWLHLCLFVGLCPREVRQEMARRDQQGEERDEWLSRRRWARNWAYELLTGYGEWPHMPLIWAAVVVLLFAAIYAAAGNIASGDVGALEGQPTHSPITTLVHSISAFATIGFNTLEPQGWGARLLTALEAMLGIGLFALFVFTLGNRMRRS